MKDFAAIDFETANGRRTSVCSVGVVVVRGGEVVDTLYSLIRPRPNFYSRFTFILNLYSVSVSSRCTNLTNIPIRIIGETCVRSRNRVICSARVKIRLVFKL